MGLYRGLYDLDERDRAVSYYKDPELLERRKKIGPRRKQNMTQKIIMFLAIFGLLGLTGFLRLRSSLRVVSGASVYLSGWRCAGRAWIAHRPVRVQRK